MSNVLIYLYATFANKTLAKLESWILRMLKWYNNICFAFHIQNVPNIDNHQITYTPKNLNFAYDCENESFLRKRKVIIFIILSDRPYEYSSIAFFTTRKSIKSIHKIMFHVVWIKNCYYLFIYKQLLGSVLLGHRENNGYDQRQYKFYVKSMMKV